MEAYLVNLFSVEKVTNLNKLLCLVQIENIVNEQNLPGVRINQSWSPASETRSEACVCAALTSQHFEFAEFFIWTWMMKT